ncbi:MAG: trypsin-like peptidase domain-containing protein [bacterium]|nr:trypsin-like peptidase domain-containing protein [bacterium]
MKHYSIKEIIFTALFASFLTAILIGPISSGAIIAKASVTDFFNQFLKQFNIYEEKPKSETPKEFNLDQSKAVYVPTGYEEQLVNVVKKTSPAVVSVTVTKNVPIIEQYYINPFGNDPFFQKFFGGELQIPQYRQKGIEKKEIGGGSGFIISANGLILTNKHVVSDTEAEYTVFTNDGKKYPAQVLARDPVQDLAVLKINVEGLKTLTLADSDNIEVGQIAIAIGNALGEFRNTVNVGVVSGIGRSITASGAGTSETLQNVIQTDASINPGNSGGPLLNLRGEVIGINTAIASGAQSIGFAIPINQAKRDINDAITKGKIVTPYLGVRYLTITPTLKDEKKLPFDYGALVSKGTDGEAAVVSGSPADNAGIKEGDIILEFGSKKVDKEHQLAPLIILYSVGDSISLKIWRDGKIITLQVILAEKP